MTVYQQLQSRLPAEPRTWLVTGVADFIGRNLLEALLKLGQRVVGLDNLATGHQRNLVEVQTLVTPAQWANFSFINSDIRNLADCQKAMVFVPAAGIDDKDCHSGESRNPSPSPALHPATHSVDYVLHQAALGNVPRSLADPIATHATNNSGFLNMLTAARDAKVRSFTYAASSSTYGDHPGTTIAWAVVTAGAARGVTVRSRPKVSKYPPALPLKSTTVAVSIRAIKILK